MSVPALTLAASAVLVMTRLAQLTVIAMGPTAGLPSFVLVRLAELLYVAQLVALVAAVTWTDRLAPGARLIGWPTRLSAWAPSAPAMAKLAGLPTPASLTQWTGVPALPPGNASVRLTPVAVPAPLLVTVTV